ncbi:hypothetical protein AVI51_06175 [Piscirickettsia salmonis]|uniref:Uncharacterized protein n=1 Tax=Piscirickettsia salmonis TaxID=1238 RepID=A0A9Q5VDR9_PISSA|nr:hypothetical protein [Piscirickettsia salmonis]ALA25678.1 pertussis toxin, subunit 1 [Piscirickettsia salmonis]APS43169.1 hypothetical protein AVI48_01395 [Piscirickettsia salmonis]APS46517.1 hypothetical protein AVI49_01995 [Piscirickettsia salmonis]APS50487.1 hypothetical protein AVI50_06240 [Piscirickettsia salmonis]APS53690.1 hypothetical protein AVI51_06175 [Piscirickettsia salmonis]
MPIASFDITKICEEWESTKLGGIIEIQSLPTAFRGMQIERSEAEHIFAEGMWSRARRNLEKPNYSPAKHIESLNGANGYVSTTTDLSVAKKFAKKRGFVFLIMPEVAIKITGSTTVNALKEQELIIPNGVPPGQVLACRACESGTLVGPIYTNSSLNEIQATLVQILLTDNGPNQKPHIFPINGPMQPIPKEPVEPPPPIFLQEMQAAALADAPPQDTGLQAWLPYDI